MSRLLSPDQVADRLGVKVKTVYSLIHEQGLPAFRVGRSFRVSETEMNRWLEAQRVERNKSLPEWWELLPKTATQNSKNHGPRKLEWGTSKS